MLNFKFIGGHPTDIPPVHKRGTIMQSNELVSMKKLLLIRIRYIFALRRTQALLGLKKFAFQLKAATFPRSSLQWHH